MNWSRSEEDAARKLLHLALDEDFGSVGDRTSDTVVPPELRGQAVFVARSAGVVAGLPLLPLIFGEQAKVDLLLGDGSRLERGTTLARVAGPMQHILRLERISLNFLQRLSGVASLTRRHVDLVSDLRCRILDTRKTTPGWRLLEKYAVRCGGGHNHRMGLYDGVMLKDNHLAALARAGQPVSIPEAIALVRARLGTTLPLEVEVDTLDQLDEALPAGPDMVLLDNMTNEQMREAVRRRNGVAPKVQLEASGGINFTTLRGIAETGVDRISIGALTHSAVALDIGLDYLDS